MWWCFEKTLRESDYIMRIWWINKSRENAFEALARDEEMRIRRERNII